MSQQKEDTTTKKWPMKDNFSFVKKLNDPRFGEISIYKSKSQNEVIFFKTHMVSNQKELQNIIQQHQIRMSLNHPSILNLIDFEYEEVKKLCSTNYQVSGIYIYPKSDTLKEAQGLKKQNQFFTGNNLEKIAGQSLQGIAHLHEQKLSHGDIKPQTIGYDPQSERYVILDRLKDLKDMEKLQIENLSSDKNLYLSPELYKKLGGKQKDQEYDIYKNDSFALGLTLLELGNQKSVQDIYEKNGDINRDVLFNHVSDFDKRYKNSNPILSKIVNNLIEIDPDQRLNSNQLLKDCAWKTGINKSVGFDHPNAQFLYTQEPNAFDISNYKVNSSLEGNIFYSQKPKQHQYRAMSFINTDFSNVQKKVDENLAKENLSIMEQQRNNDYQQQTIQEEPDSEKIEQLNNNGAN